LPHSLANHLDDMSLTNNPHNYRRKDEMPQIIADNLTADGYHVDTAQDRN
jgi:hypothetical protein